MPTVTGRTLPLPPPRVWMADLMHASRNVPLAAVERVCDVSAAAARRGKVPWAALFVRAYAVVAAGRPELRRSYQAWPWPHLFEADRSIASVAVAREYEGEPAVFFAKLDAPDRLPLAAIAAELVRWKTAPVEEVRSFARLVRYSRYPRPVRRLAWAAGMHLSGRHRARTFGTFGLTAAGAGADIPVVRSPLATTLTYGPLRADGTMAVRLTFDHRVLDGRTAAAALEAVERVLAAGG
jgi:hypothetical protein